MKGGGTRQGSACPFLTPQGATAGAKTCSLVLGTDQGLREGDCPWHPLSFQSRSFLCRHQKWEEVPCTRSGRRVIVHTSLWSPEAPLHSPWGYIHTHRLSCKQGQASLGIPAFQKKILSFQEAQRLPRPPAGQGWRKTPAWAWESPNTKLGHLSRVSGHIPVLAGAREGTRKGDGGQEGQPQGKLEETTARQRPGPDSPCWPC